MNYIFGLIFVAFCNITLACPTCVGRPEHGSPAFFSDEHYAPAEKNDETTKEPKQVTQEETDEEQP